MHNFTPLPSFLGGLLIGFAALILLSFSGRIAGISGILGSSLSLHLKDMAWRVCFLLGLIVAGIVVFQGNFIYFPDNYDISTPKLIIAGLLVGFGTRLGSGCTSGHGICGISRFSLRSILATLTFIVFGILTVWIFK